MKPHSASVTLTGVRPDSKAPSQYEITQKKQDPDARSPEAGKSSAAEETYIDSPTGRTSLWRSSR